MNIRERRPPRVREDPRNSGGQALRAGAVRSSATASKVRPCFRRREGHRSCARQGPARVLDKRARFAADGIVHRTWSLPCVSDTHRMIPGSEGRQSARSTSRTLLGPSPRLCRDRRSGERPTGTLEPRAPRTSWLTAPVHVPVGSPLRRQSRSASVVASCSKDALQAGLAPVGVDIVRQPLVGWRIALFRVEAGRIEQLEGGFRHGTT